MNQIASLSKKTKKNHSDQFGSSIHELQVKFYNENDIHFEKLGYQYVNQKLYVSHGNETCPGIQTPDLYGTWAFPKKKNELK